MQDDTADGADDMNAQLQEPDRAARSPGFGQPELLHEHVGGGRQQDPNWFAANRQQLVRSICSPSSSSLIRFSMSPRAQSTFS